MGRARGLQQLWQREIPGSRWPLWAVLTPLAALYAGALDLRSRWWRGHAQSAPITTISIGNLTVGGNGKTPFTLFLAKTLQARGYRVGIVSRGYGRRNSGRQKAALIADRGVLLTDAASAGDEPAMMAHRFDGPIGVARRRIRAIRLLADRMPLDAVILDDAFQHQRLRRDVDVIVIASHVAFGNGWLLPAGPLREPLASLSRAAAAIVIGDDPANAGTIMPELRTALGERAILSAILAPIALVSSRDGGWIASPIDIRHRRIAAVSGIADPSGFIAALTRLGGEIVEHLDFADHHQYSSKDWQRLRAIAACADLLITTEKDLVKLETFSPTIGSLYALRNDIVMPKADETRLIDLVSGFIERRRARIGRAPIEPCSPQARA
jgi:tetraacyldisaccharide 4'-kinase